MVENYGHISRCDNIGMYARYIYKCACVCARFEKIFNDNRAHISIQVREKKRKNKKRDDEEEEEGGGEGEEGMIVQYRVYAEGGMYVCIVPFARMNE